MRKVAVYVNDDVYLFNDRDEAEEYAETKRGDEDHSVKVEADYSLDEDIDR